MPKSKVQSASDDSLGEGREVRRRVVKACQRCRLKKCKARLDLTLHNQPSRPRTNPSLSVMAPTHVHAAKPTMPSAPMVNTGSRTRPYFVEGLSLIPMIAAIHKLTSHSYVQMLERQHTELISGLQELYRRIQAGEPFPSLPLEPAYNGQPLTHKILEALGVLPSDEDWEDGDKAVPFESMTWQGLEQEEYAYDVCTATTSPATQTPFSPITITPFPQSTIMAKRARKLQDSSCIINNNNDDNNKDHNQTSFVGNDAVLSMPPIYQHHGVPSASPFHVMQQQQHQQPQSRHPQQPQVHQQHQHQHQQPLQYYANGDGESGYESVDWTFGCNEDLFNDNQGLVVQLA